MTLVRAALALATCLGLGYVPFAPGTFGSAAGLLVWAVLPQSTAAHGVAIVLIFVVGVWSAGIAEQHLRGTDPGPVVIDEVMGMLVTLFMVPVGWPGAAAGFLLFRIFDVIKPPPASQLEHLRGGMGVMADDFMAAVYANIALRITLALGNRVISQLGN
ncbi:MAG TPA: phosphatidylglycerophosphatase A [Hyphomicrobiaceae bacterium]|nr:phosphatidylglycerophosphatase A [Hyphomicrobiaceae bacterium]